ncbi:hypothetical protein [Oleisolibacter albus]|uniref:hypothetical protein n=1 Tax=Oleisolibacter albus TaxID=2171757 RepID=UPI0012D7AA99|nr:hypothetical protein [Oleisolibacter albus]
MTLLIHKALILATVASGFLAVPARAQAADSAVTSCSGSTGQQCHFFAVHEGIYRIEGTPQGASAGASAISVAGYTCTDSSRPGPMKCYVAVMGGRNYPVSFTVNGRNVGGSITVAPEQPTNGATILSIP